MGSYWESVLIFLGINTVLALSLSGVLSAHALMKLRAYALS